MVIRRDHARNFVSVGAVSLSKAKMQAQIFRALLSPKVYFFQWHLRDFPACLLIVNCYQDKWGCPEARPGPLTDKWF